MEDELVRQYSNLGLSEGMDNMQSMQGMHAMEDDEAGTCNLIVNYLPHDVDDLSLRALFQDYGDILMTKVVRDKNTKKSMGYGFVKFGNESDAMLAIEKMNGYQLGHKNLKVSIARPPSLEIRNCKLYVTNLPKDYTERDVVALFKEFGEIIECRVLKDRNSKINKGVAFVQFNVKAQANNALSLNGCQLEGAARPLIVKYAEDQHKKKELSRLHNLTINNAFRGMGAGMGGMGGGGMGMNMGMAPSHESHSPKSYSYPNMSPYTPPMSLSPHSPHMNMLPSPVSPGGNWFGGYMGAMGGGAMGGGGMGGMGLGSNSNDYMPGGMQGGMQGMGMPRGKMMLNMGMLEMDRMAYHPISPHGIPMSPHLSPMNSGMPGPPRGPYDYDPYDQPSPHQGPPHHQQHQQHHQGPPHQGPPHHHQPPQHHGQNHQQHPQHQQQGHQQHPQQHQQHSPPSAQVVLHMSNLPPIADVALLQDLCGAYGRVLSASMESRSPTNSSSSPRGRVHMENINQAEMVAQALNGVVLFEGGMPLQVQISVNGSLPHRL